MYLTLCLKQHRNQGAKRCAPHSFRHYKEDVFRGIAQNQGMGIPQSGNEIGVQDFGIRQIESVW